MICSEKKRPCLCTTECEKYSNCKARLRLKRILLTAGQIKKKQPNLIKDDLLYHEKKEALIVCNDLFYDDQCKEDIINAKTESEIQRALINAGNRKFGDN